MTSKTSLPIFWRDPRMPYVELRKVEDGRQVNYALHSHTQWSLGAITAGKSTYRYREDLYTVQKGDLVLMNPEWVHTCNPIDNHPWAYVMMYIDTDWLTELRFELGLIERLEWQHFTQATLSDEDWYQRYCHVAQVLLNTEYPLLEKQSQFVTFLNDLMRVLSCQSEGPIATIPGNLEAIARYLDEQVTEDISLDLLCKRFGYSSGYLIRAFSQHFGMTPHAYLLNRRIQLGRTQLKTGKAIADVAQNVGFADQPHFQRVFKRHMAATPNQYRRTLISQ